mmetsp:Transcript_16553/g.39818  ORF Transcript_16553/g.39818 Transcript_16553/m.39818 type:complete len:695 (-) Transcript_16553:309-2393(-)
MSFNHFPPAFAPMGLPPHPMMVGAPIINGGHHEVANPDVVDLNIDQGMEWAMREQFSRSQAQNFRELLNLMKPIHVNPGDIRGSRVVGSGSFGTIFSASWNGKPVAVKKISKDQNADKSMPQKMRELFLELHVMNRLKHPYVLKLLGVASFFPAAGTQELYLGIVVELCDGTLQKLIRSNTPLSFDQKATIAQQVLMGMTYMHSQSVIHRDLTTENVLLVKGSVRIADFGCARKIADGKYDSSTISGSPAYMPPEQMEGGRLTLKVDVWAMGVILWEIATRMQPWAELGNVGGMEGFNLVKAALIDRKQQLTAAPQNCLPSNKYQPYNRLIGMAMAWQAEERPMMADLLHEFQTSVCDPHMVEPPVSADGTPEPMPESSPANMPVQSAQAPPRGSPVLPAQQAVPPPRMHTNVSLLQRIERFYMTYNPTKLSEAPSMADFFDNDEEELNKKLRERYNADLTTTDGMPPPANGARPQVPNGLPRTSPGIGPAPSQPAPAIGETTSNSVKVLERALGEKNSQLEAQERKIEAQERRIQASEQETDALRLELRGLQQRMATASLTNAGPKPEGSPENRSAGLTHQLGEIRAALALREEQLEDERKRVSTLETHIQILKQKSTLNAAPSPSVIGREENISGAGAGDERKEAEIAGLRKQVQFQQRKIQLLEGQLSQTDKDKVNSAMGRQGQGQGQVFM